MGNTVRGPKSAKHDDAPSKAHCPSGSKLTGCMCWSPWESCDGAESQGNTCTAYNSYRGNGVYATARCVKSKGNNKITAPVIAELEEPVEEPVEVPAELTKS